MTSKKQFISVASTLVIFSINSASAVQSMNCMTAIQIDQHSTTNGSIGALDHVQLPGNNPGDFLLVYSNRSPGLVRVAKFINGQKVSTAMLPTPGFALGNLQVARIVSSTSNTVSYYVIFASSGDAGSSTSISHAAYILNSSGDYVTTVTPPHSSRFQLIRDNSGYSDTYVAGPSLEYIEPALPTTLFAVTRICGGLKFNASTNSLVCDSTRSGRYVNSGLHNPVTGSLAYFPRHFHVFRQNNRIHIMLDTFSYPNSFTVERLNEFPTQVGSISSFGLESRFGVSGQLPVASRDLVVDQNGIIHKIENDTSGNAQVIRQNPLMTFNSTNTIFSALRLFYDSMGILSPSSNQGVVSPVLDQNPIRGTFSASARLNGNFNLRAGFALDYPSIDQYQNPSPNSRLGFVPDELWYAPESSTQAIHGWTAGPYTWQASLVKSGTTGGTYNQGILKTTISVCQ